VSEKEQRWGAKTVEGSGHQASVEYVVQIEYLGCVFVVLFI